MKRISKILTLTLLTLSATAVRAEKDPDFDDYFIDQTLRVDYIFTGDKDGSQISLRSMETSDGWYGRRHSLGKLPLLGNGQLTMTDIETGDTIYRTSFSSLYTEWLDTDEAASVRRSTEHTVLAPRPVKKADIKLELIDYDHNVMAAMKHTYDPDDILVKFKSPVRISPFQYIHKSGNPREKIDVAIVAEGFTEEEMPQFLKKAQETVDAVFSYEPFGSMKDAFNFVAVMSPSADSGVSMPKTGIWKDTALGSHYSTHYSDRYLTTSKVFQLNDILSGIPYEHIIIVANSEGYGGGGIYNDYTIVTSDNPKFRPVVVHEFGHSFGGLADEYFYDSEPSELYSSRVEPWEPNITTMCDFDSKWKGSLKKGTPIPTPVEDKDKYPIGVYEGGGYNAHGVFRPAFDCRMRTNECEQFCPVCQEALKSLIEFYVNK